MTLEFELIEARIAALLKLLSPPEREELLRALLRQFTSTEATE